MAGSVRLGFGYTMLVLGLIYVVLMIAVIGVDFSASGGEGSVTGNPTSGSVRGGNSEVTWDISPWLLMFPGIALIIASAPLIVFGHLANRDEQAAADGPATTGEQH